MLLSWSEQAARRQHRRREEAAAAAVRERISFPFRVK